MDWKAEFEAAYQSVHGKRGALTRVSRVWYVITTVPPTSQRFRRGQIEKMTQQLRRIAPSGPQAD